jgi:hypothetical protein
MADRTCGAEHTSATEISQGLKKLATLCRGGRGTGPEVDGLETALGRQRRQALQMATLQVDPPQPKAARLAMAHQMQTLDLMRSGHGLGKQQGAIRGVDQRQRKRRMQAVEEQIQLGQRGIGN